MQYLFLMSSIRTIIQVFSIYGYLLTVKLLDMQGQNQPINLVNNSYVVTVIYRIFDRRA